MPEFTELWAGGPVFAQAEHFRLGTDSVLLADFVNTSGAARGVDLGCASGAIALLLLARSPALHMTGLELLPDAAALARENLEKNGLADRGEIIAGDIRRHRALFARAASTLWPRTRPTTPRAAGLCRATAAAPPQEARRPARSTTSAPPRPSYAAPEAASRWSTSPNGSRSCCAR